MGPSFLLQVFTLKFPSPSLATVDRRVSMALVVTAGHREGGGRYRGMRLRGTNYYA